MITRDPYNPKYWKWCLSQTEQEVKEEDNG